MPKDQLSFHNPYHFVPVEKSNHENWFAVKEFDNRKLTYYGHDRYYPDTYSGRIVCRLTTESPIVIGGEREKPTNDNEPATVKPFELTPGLPAIPASSLRGLLSSLAETASNSALRVLDDKVLSYRKAMNESLSALGMVFVDKRDENGNPIAYRLKPLALPLLQKMSIFEQGKKTDGYTYAEKKPEDSDNIKQEKLAYAEMFKGPARLKVYVKGYDDEGNPIDFLPYKQTFSLLTHPEFYYARLQGLKFVQKHGIWLITEKDHLQLTHGGHAVGQKIMADTQILSEEEWNDLPGDEKRSYTRGILRVLGKQGRTDMPDSKKYEFFIPYPKEAETKWATFPVLPEAIERFEQLADERTKADENPPLPYEPLGTKRNEDHEKLGEKLRLKEGDIMYFRPTLNTKGEAVVAEIAFSSIWRGRVEFQGEPATVHKFFEQIDPELLPFHQGRNYLSPAELLFGFVQKDDKDKKTSDAGRALAGRVQVSFGQLAQPHPHPYYEGKVLLKSLLSPKLPCPAMYFKPSPHSNPDDYITKPDLSPLKHRPQGRKMYLHHPNRVKQPRDEENKKTGHDDNVNRPWESRDAENKNTLKLKTYATPIREGLPFYFHLDFNNLDDFELGLLFYALRPNREFRHKLGMGKAIGLGTVRIDPVGWFLIDRDQRYRIDDIFQGQRYHQVWIAGDAEKEKWPESYEREKQAEGTAPNLHWETLREKFRVTMTGVIRKALELLGDPAKVTAVVHTPQIFTSCDKEDNPLPRVNEVGMELESFKWFVENEKGPRQMLEPLNKESKDLPTLKRIAAKKEK